MKPKLTYIVAGTRAEFEDWVRQKMALKVNIGAVVYVDGPHVLRGKKNVHGFYVGTYEKRADIYHIKEMIALANMFRVITPLNLPNQPIQGVEYEGAILDELPVNKSVNNHL